MNRLIYGLCCLALFVALAGCKKNPPTSPKQGSKKQPVRSVAKADTSLPGDAVAGEAVFKKTCLACHGANGRGNGGVTAVDFLKDKSRLKKDNKILLRSIRDGVKNGSRIMPPHKGTLTEKQIRDALSYVRKKFGTP